MTGTPAGHATRRGGTAAGATDRPDLGDQDPRAYRQMAARIRRQILDGTLKAGQPAPSITSLLRETGHARQTCAHALRLLEDEGLLQRVPGLGYHVTGEGNDAAASHGAAPAPQPCAGTGHTGKEHARPATRQEKPASPGPADPGRDGAARETITPESQRAAPVMPVFRPATGAPAGTQARPERQPAPRRVAAASQDDVGRAPAGGSVRAGVRLENMFDQHADAWPAGQDHLRWLVLPASSPEAEAADELAGQYRDLTWRAGLTAVSPRWLHIAVGHAGPAGELAADELAELVSVVRERCARLPGPFGATLGPARATAVGVACAGRPVGALRGLQAITADALKGTGHRFPAPPAASTAPHMALAYATGPGPAGPLEAWLASHETAEARILVTAVELVAMRHDGSQVTWRTLETIPLGRERQGRRQ